MSGKNQTSFPRDYGALACRHVFEGSRPVLRIARDDEGDFAFLCGHSDHSTDEETLDYRWIAVGVLLDRDSSINKASNLAKEMVATRTTVSDPWSKASFKSE